MTTVDATAVRARAVRVRRAARTVLGLTLGVAVGRVLSVPLDRAAFVQAYGQYKKLDMGSFLGQEIAKRDAPVHLDSAMFSLLCVVVLVAPLVPSVRRSLRWAPYLALVLGTAGALNTLGSVAVPAPWWYHLLTVLLVALSCALVVVLWRGRHVVDVDAADRAGQGGRRFDRG